MMKWTFIIILLFSWNFSFSQDSLDYKWKKVGVFDIPENEIWTIDAMEYTYQTKGGLIEKHSPNGKRMYSQSIKSLGNMKQLIPINTMKLVYFSEEQQTLCFLDNTLSSMNDCIELADKGIIYASIVEGSSQPNKLWVLDNVNSTLFLLSLDATRQQQEIKNLKGILDIEQVTQLIERNNRLFLFDAQKGVYVMDLYGTLIEFIPSPHGGSIEAFENSLFIIAGNKMEVHSLKTDEIFTIALPVKDIKSFVYLNQHFYFRTEQAVYNYTLQFSE